MTAVRATGATLADIEELEALVASLRERVSLAKTASKADLAGRFYKLRRQRDAVFGEHAQIFGEPAWDMVLDLYRATLLDRPVSISSACIGANAAATTALRRLKLLESRGLVDCVRDGNDARRTFVSASDMTIKLVDCWLDHASTTLQSGPS